MKSWETKKEELVFESPYLNVRKTHFVTPDGVEGEWFIHEHHDAVAIVGQLSEDEFVLVNEYRYVHDRACLGWSMGAVDEGESMEETARREFQEEVGYKIGTLVELGRMATAPAFSKEIFGVFLARDLEKTETSLGDKEYIEPVVMSRKEIDEAIISNKIWGSNTIACWQLAKLHLDNE